MSLRDRFKELFASSPLPRVTPILPVTPDISAPIQAKQPAGRPARSGLHPRLLSAGVSFGLRLHRQLAGERPRDNLVLCPVSIGLTLAMTTNGARGQTRDSMARILGIENMEAEECNEGYAEILKALRIRGEKVELRLGNSLWVDDAYAVLPEFVSACKKYYDAEVVNISFRSADAATRINRWVSEQTAGKISEIIEHTSALDQLLLLNAAYFLGRWANPFDPDKTREGIFHAASGRRPHPMMHQGGHYDYLETDGFQGVALPYGFWGTAMYLFLPRERIALAKFLEEIDAAKWQKWMAGFQDRQGEIVVPRFQARCDAELTGALRALGMTAPFERGRADFSGMFLKAFDSFVNRFLHKTFLDVNEKGTEAAAATGKMIRLTYTGPPPTPPFRMVVDRPFFLAIRDKLSGLLLFTGSVLEP